MSKGRHVRLTLQDLRIGKIGRNRKFSPCSQEFDAYVTALEGLGETGLVPPQITRALSDCMKNHESKVKPPSFAVNYHIAKYVDRTKRPKK